MRTVMVSHFFKNLFGVRDFFPFLALIFRDELSVSRVMIEFTVNRWLVKETRIAPHMEIVKIIVK